MHYQVPPGNYCGTHSWELLCTTQCWELMLGTTARNRCSRVPVVPGNTVPGSRNPGPGCSRVPEPGGREQLYPGATVPGSRLFPGPGTRGPGTTVPGSNCSRERLLSARNRCRDRPPGTLFPGTTVPEPGGREQLFWGATVPGNYYLVPGTAAGTDRREHCSREQLSRNPGAGNNCFEEQLFPGTTT
jgi:hypothetical protein